MLTFQKLVKYLDIYGETIQLNIENESKSKTFLGGILTIITVGMLIGAAWSTGNDIIYKNQPSTDMEDILFKDRPFYYLDKYTFPLSFCFQDYNQQVYDIPSYFKFEVINIKTFNTNTTTITTFYEYENCTYDHFPNLEPEYIDKSGIRSYKCLKDQNITIGGYWDNSFVQYTTFRIRLCNNATEGGICAPIEEIEQFINSRPIAWNVYFQNSMVNAKDYYNPTQQYIVIQYKNVRLTASKVLNMFIRSQEIQTDIGIIFESINGEVSYAYDSGETDDSDALPESMMDINLYAASHKVIYHRKYLKVQSLLANLGGLAKALFLGMYLISFYFSQIELDTTILNKIIDFNMGQKKKSTEESLEESNKKLRSDMNNTITISIY
jgi:hypothetical protein